MKYLQTYSQKIKHLYIIGIIFFLLSFALGLGIGSTDLNWSAVWNSDTTDSKILLYVRLPRAIASLVCGGALAVSGTVIQGILANDLASPSIIGINSGAGLAVTLAVAVGVYGGWETAVIAFVGAFVAAIIVNAGAKKFNASKGAVILLGVAVNSLFNAISDAIITIVPDASVMSNHFKMGDLSAVTLKNIIPVSVIVAVTVVLVYTMSNTLNVLTLGDGVAKGLGVNTTVQRGLFLAVASILAGASVSVAGLLSFVGLIIPHIVKGLAGAESKNNIVLSFLYGGGFVCVCDIIARTIFSPFEIPVGIIMSFLGVPFFLFILFKKRRGSDDRY